MSPEQLEKTLLQIKADLQAIKKVLGIGATAPFNVMDIQMIATHIFDRLTLMKNTIKTIIKQHFL